MDVATIAIAATMIPVTSLLLGVPLPPIIVLALVAHRRNARESLAS
jgi:hypothetical protein